jgi:hypothetical protein
MLIMNKLSEMLIACPNDYTRKHPAVSTARLYFLRGRKRSGKEEFRLVPLAIKW